MDRGVSALAAIGPVTDDEDRGVLTAEPAGAMARLGWGSIA